MHNPEPVEHNLAVLAQAVADEHADVGLALDGDADRLGVMDEHGRFITQLQTYALLVYYLLEVRGLRGLVVKSVTTSSMIWRLGERYGVPVRETGVGFKYIAPLMAEENALAGGEESGGYAFRGHLPERDGILSGLFVLDLMARTGKRLPELLEELYRLVGPHHYARWDVPFDATEQGRVRDRVSQAEPDTLGGVKVTGARRHRRLPVPSPGRRVGNRSVLRHGAPASHLRRGRHPRPSPTRPRGRSSSGGRVAGNRLDQGLPVCGEPATLPGASPRKGVREEREERSWGSFEASDYPSY